MISENPEKIEKSRTTCLQKITLETILGSTLILCFTQWVIFRFSLWHDRAILGLHLNILLKFYLLIRTLIHYPSVLYHYLVNRCIRKKCVYIIFLFWINLSIMIAWSSPPISTFFPISEFSYFIIAKLYNQVCSISIFGKKKSVANFTWKYSEVLQ